MWRFNQHSRKASSYSIIRKHNHQTITRLIKKVLYNPETQHRTKRTKIVFCSGRLTIHRTVCDMQNVTGQFPAHLTYVKVRFVGTWVTWSQCPTLTQIMNYKRTLYWIWFYLVQSFKICSAVPNNFFFPFKTFTFPPLGHCRPGQPHHLASPSPIPG